MATRENTKCIGNINVKAIPGQPNKGLLERMKKKIRNVSRAVIVFIPALYRVVVTHDGFFMVSKVLTCW